MLLILQGYSYYMMHYYYLYLLRSSRTTPYVFFSFFHLTLCCVAVESKHMSNSETFVIYESKHYFILNVFYTLNLAPRKCVAMGVYFVHCFFSNINLQKYYSSICGKRVFAKSSQSNRQHFVFKIRKAKSIQSILLPFFKRWNPKLVENVDAMARKYQHNKHILLNRVKKIYNVKHFDEKPTKLQFNLIQFYMANEPKNIKNVPLILKKYKGREKKLKTILEKHYPNSYLVLPSAQSKKTIQARSAGVH